MSDNKKNMISAIIGTTIAELITIPICTIKSNYQNNIINGLSIKNYCSNIYITRGIKGFYNASLYASISQMISQTSKYTLYEYIKKKRNSTTIYDNMLNSMFSSSISSIFHHPFDYAKINTQLDKNIINIIKKNGILTVYTGYNKTLIRNLSTSIILPINDQYKKLYENYFSDSLTIMFSASFSAAITTTIILYPLDFIRNRQIANNNWYFGLNIFKYYRGASLGLLRNTIHFVIFMCSLELIKKYY